MPELVENEPKITLAPKTTAQIKAEEIRLERELPKKPGDHVSFDEMKRYLAVLEDAQLRRLNIYVYRSDPVIKNQNIDPDADNNIDIFYDINKQSLIEITEDYFINHHGGGRYKLVVKDLERPNPKAGFFDANLYVSMTQYPPKIPDLRVVDWDHKNNKGYKTWLRANKLIDENNMPTLDKKTEPINSSENMALPMLKMFMEYTEKQDKVVQDKIKTQLGGEGSIGKGISEILLERMKQDDPTKLITTLVTLMGAFGSKDKGDGGNFMQMIQMINEGQKTLFMGMMENQKNQTQLMLEMIKESKKTDTTSSSPMTQMKEMFGLMKEMKWGGPTNTVEEPRTLTDRIIEAAVEILPKGLDLVNNIMGLNAAAKGITLPSMRNADPNDPNGPLMNPQQTQQPTPQATQQIGPITMTLQQKQDALRQFAPLLETWLTRDGCEFADWIENGFPQGGTIVASIIKDGADDLLNTLKSMPELWVKLSSTYGEPHLVNWIKSFVNYKEEMKEE